MAPVLLSSNRFLRRLVALAFLFCAQFAGYAEDNAAGKLESPDREQTRSDLLEDVSQSWRRVAPQSEREAPTRYRSPESPLLQKMDARDQKIWIVTMRETRN